MASFIMSCPPNAQIATKLNLNSSSLACSVPNKRLSKHLQSEIIEAIGEVGITNLTFFLKNSSVG